MSCIAPKNDKGVAFGEGLTWENYESALIDNCAEIKGGNKRFEALRSKGQ